MSAPASIVCLYSLWSSCSSVFIGWKRTHQENNDAFPEWAGCRSVLFQMNVLTPWIHIKCVSLLLRSGLSPARSASRASVCWSDTSVGTPVGPRSLLKQRSRRQQGRGGGRIERRESMQLVPPHKSPHTLHLARALTDALTGTSYTHILLKHSNSSPFVESHLHSMFVKWSTIIFFLVALNNLSTD